MKYEDISKAISRDEYAPVYYLYGEEPYFIDKLTRQIEKNALQPSEEAFNKIVTYGAETKADKLLGELRSFPMMANRRLVVLKEAQKMRKPELDKLTSYIENPVDSTVFVIAWKGKGVDGRSKLSKLLDRTGVKFKSSKIYENKVGAWIQRLVKEKGFSIDEEAVHIMVTYLGNNLGLIESEIEKIMLYMAGSGNKTISAEIIYEMINVDKSFNVFELLDAIGVRDETRSHLIMHQMMKNVKDNPPVLVVFQVFRYFSDVAILRSSNVRNQNEAAKVLGKNPFIARKYLSVPRFYSDAQIKANLVHALEADLMIKGIRPTHMGPEHILKTLVYKILN